MALTVSGGFATVQPGSVLSINAVEGYPLEDFSAEVSIPLLSNITISANPLYKAVRNQISESQKIAGGNGSEQEIAEAKIELEVCIAYLVAQSYIFTNTLQVLESLQAALK